MPVDSVIDMPTDLRPAMVPFEMDYSDKGSSTLAGITNLTVDIPSSHRTRRPEDSRPAPRWRTPEFMLYYLAFVLAVPWMVWVPVRLSSGELVCVFLGSPLRLKFWESTSSQLWAVCSQTVLGVAWPSSGEQ